MALTTEAAARKDRTTAAAYAPMQHRHFATIASIIKDRITDNSEMLSIEIARVFADELAKTNPNFDRARFLRACGFEG